MAKASKKKNKRRMKRFEQPKPCRFTRDGIFEVDYLDIETLRRYVSQQGKIHPAKKNNISAQYQRQLQTAVKRARFLGLLPVVGE